MIFLFYMYVEQLRRGLGKRSSLGTCAALLCDCLSREISRCPTACVRLYVCICHRYVEPLLILFKYLFDEMQIAR